MKVAIVLGLMMNICIAGFAQNNEEPTHAFKTNNIFMGGSIGLGFGNGSFSVGGNPEIGYSVAKWLDAGFIFNLNYYSFTAEANSGIRQRTFNYGAGAFTRIYPVPSFFLTIIPEYNIINTSLKLDATQEEQKLTEEAPSLIIGIGYGNHDIGKGSFYTMIGFDAGNNTRSPYIGYYGSKMPIIRAGFNFYLGAGKK